MLYCYDFCHPINHRYMNKTEAEKLNAYSEAISKLEPEEQFRKMNAVKSEDTVRRFLSEDAPEPLLHRFSTRITAVIAKDLSFFEQGRVAFANGNDSFARGQFMAALEQGDKRAHYYLARLDLEAGDFWKAEDHFASALNNGYKKGECWIALAGFSFMKTRLDMQEQYDQALNIFKRAVEGDDKAVRDFCHLEICLLLNFPLNEKKELLKLAKKGNEHACNTLLRIFLSEKNEEGVSMMADILARMGYTRYYQIAAKLFEDVGDTENAINYHILAIRAGHDETYPDLIKLLMECGENGQAIEYCKEAIDKGYRQAYYPLLTLLHIEQKGDEFLQYISHALFNGFDEVYSLLEMIESDETAKHVFTRKTQIALMRGEDIHPAIIERFLGIEMEKPPEGPFN